MATYRALRRRFAAKVRSIEKHRRFDELAAYSCMAPHWEIGGQLPSTSLAGSEFPLKPRIQF
jgi:hypothetical protein